MVNILKLKLGPALKIFNTIPKHWYWVGGRRSSITTDISCRAGSIQLTFSSASYKCSCCFQGVGNQWLRLKLHLKKPVLSSCTFRQNSFNLNPSKFSREKISSAKFFNLSPINTVPLAQRLEKMQEICFSLLGLSANWTLQTRIKGKSSWQIHLAVQSLTTKHDVNQDLISLRRLSYISCMHTYNVLYLTRTVTSKARSLHSVWILLCDIFWAYSMAGCLLLKN